jgi:8-oxo-dGTP diphosphatase
MPLRKAAGLLLIRADGKFLLQHRDEKARRFPLYWGFFGGGINNSETPEQAMIRETKEELGINVVDYQLALEQNFSDDFDPQGKKWIFTAPFEKQTPITLNEGQGMDWFLTEDLENLMIIPHDKKAIADIVGTRLPLEDPEATRGVDQNPATR